MAKKSVKKIKNIDEDFFSQAASACGGSLLKGINRNKYFIDSGNLALNFICSGKFIRGGIPDGITEAFGPPASSKSLLGYTLLGSAQRMKGIGVLMDTERAANETFAVSAGHVNENELIIVEPRYIEETESKVINVVRFIREHKGPDVPIMFVLDSISVLPCHREYRELELPENYTAAQYKSIVGAKEQPGERAKAAGKFFRKINSFLSDNNASMFVINQTRDAIGVMWGCHFGDSQVYLSDGSVRKIREIVENKESLEVLSYNQKNGKIEPKMITGWHDNGLLEDGQNFLKIKFRRKYRNTFGYLQCTENHQVFKYNKISSEIVEVDAGSINTGDNLALAQPYYLSDNQMQVVYGSVLGDGELRCASKETGRNVQLRFSQGKAQEDYLNFKQELMSNVMSGPIRKTRNNSHEGETKSLYELNHLESYKDNYIVPEEIIKNMDELGLAIWYLDDGTYSGYSEKYGNGKSIIYCQRFKNRECLFPIFQRLGLKVTLNDKGFVFDSDNTNKFHQIICKFVPECMEYKLNPRFRGVSGFDFKKLDSPVWKTIPGEVLSVEIKETNRKRKYDLTIEDNETYVVAGALVHNSPEVTAGGGKALPYYANCRIRTSAHKSIMHTKRDIPVGVMLKFVNKKSRSFVPFMQTEQVPLYFSDGIDPTGGLLSVLIAADRVEMKSAGNYFIKKEYSETGEEVTFKGSKTENRIPIDVVINNPKLIDAESSKEVLDYLEVYNNAIDLADNQDLATVGEDGNEIDFESLQKLGIAREE